MSGMVEKVKAKVDGVLHKDKTSDPTGPHDSHMANKADPRVDSDHIGTTGNVGSAAHGTTGTHTGTHTGMTGTGMTGTHTGTHTGTTDRSGPHDSRLANKADPRVDSDRYGAAGNVGSAGYSDASGLHSSHLANQADPRMGGGIGSTTHGTTGTHTGNHTGMTGTGMTGTHTGTTDRSGPHDSHLANKLDPRVDSSHVGTTGNVGTGNLAHRENETGDLPRALVEPQSHAVPHSSTTGVHDSHLANQADPRVGGIGNTTHGTTGTHTGTGIHGTHGTTHVPGKPSMMDKLNPNKDADHDGKAGILD